MQCACSSSCVARWVAVTCLPARRRVFTTARGRDAVFCQSPRTRKQARPNVTTPSVRAAGIAGLVILVDTREQYAYRFATQQATTVKRALPCGDYAVTLDDRLAAAVERKSLADLVSSLINGKLRYALGELTALPRAAVVVEDRYSQVFTRLGLSHRAMGSRDACRDQGVAQGSGCSACSEELILRLSWPLVMPAVNRAHVVPQAEGPAGR